MRGARTAVDPYRAITPGAGRWSRLPAAACERFEAVALAILERTGVRIDHPEVRALLASAGARVDETDRVRFPAPLVREALAVAPSTVAIHDRLGRLAFDWGGENAWFGPGSDCLHVVDARTRERRAATFADLERAISLVDALPNMAFAMSVFLPADRDGRIADRYQAEVMLTRTHKPLVFVTYDVDGTRDVLEMAEAVAAATAVAGAAATAPATSATADTATVATRNRASPPPGAAPIPASGAPAASPPPGAAPIPASGAPAASPPPGAAPIPAFGAPAAVPSPLAGTSAPAGTSALAARPFAAWYINVTRGLWFGEDSLAKLLLLVDHGQPAMWIPVTSGATTGPVTLAGTLAVNHAGVLAGIVIAQLRRAGAPVVIPGFGGDALDLRTTVDPYMGADPKGAAEALAHHLRLPMFSLAGGADAKVVDEQAAAEAALGILGDALAAGQVTHDSGYLESGLAGSLGQLAICDEIVSWTRAATAPVDLSDEALALDLVDALGVEGSFLEVDHTMERYRERWYPDLFDRRSRSAWEAKGSSTLAERAADRSDALLAAHVPPPTLPDAATTAIREIVARAEARAGL